MNLVIDIGNSLVKLYIFDQNQILVSLRVKPQLAYQNVRKLLDQYKPQYSIYSCVGTEIPEIKQLLSTATNFIQFSHTTPIPLENLYHTPETLGPDRLAAAVGANFLFPNANVLIIDIGTAITFDLVTDKAQFIGGNISLGPELRAKALNAFTARLPLVQPQIPNSLLGRSTKEAINNGIVWAITYEIQGYINELSNNFKNLRTILTGGYAYFFEKILKSSIFVEMNLVPLGLNRIIEFNKQTSL